MRPKKLTSFNKWVDELRYMPHVKLLDELRGKLAETMWFRKTTADRWNHPLTPKVSYRIRKIQEKAKELGSMN